MKSATNLMVQKRISSGLGRRLTKSREALKEKKKRSVYGGGKEAGRGEPGGEAGRSAGHDGKEGTTPASSVSVHTPASGRRLAPASGGAEVTSPPGSEGDNDKENGGNGGGNNGGVESGLNSNDAKAG